MPLSVAVLLSLSFQQIRHNFPFPLSQFKVLCSISFQLSRFFFTLFTSLWFSRFISTFPLSSICHYEVCAEHCTRLRCLIPKNPRRVWQNRWDSLSWMRGVIFIVLCNPISDVAHYREDCRTFMMHPDFLVYDSASGEEQLGLMDPCGNWLVKELGVYRLLRLVLRRSMSLRFIWERDIDGWMSQIWAEKQKVQFLNQNQGWIKLDVEASFEMPPIYVVKNI